MVKSDKNPGGLPIEVFDKFRAETANNRAQFYQDVTIPFYGYNRPGAKISQGVRDNWWRQGMMGGIKAQYDCIKAFSETDFTEDLRARHPHAHAAGADGQKSTSAGMLDFPVDISPWKNDKR
jgi:non-heme chloroperoxidase